MNRALVIGDREMVNRIIKSEDPVIVAATMLAIAALILLPIFVVILCAPNNSTEFIDDCVVWNSGKCPICETNWVLYKDSTDDFRTYRCSNSHEIVITTDVDNWSSQKVFKTRIKQVDVEK